jgi:hypothetical protein
MKNDKILIITQIAGVIYRLKLLKPNNTNIDVFLQYNKSIEYPENKLKNYQTNEYIANIYGSHEKNKYIEKINQLKKNELAFGEKKKIISCHYGYITGLSLTASYKMLLQLPEIISSLGIAFKTLETHGTLLLFWTIINIHIPSVKKIMHLLCYAFENIEVITDDINQNFFQGITEYYIKCSGFRANVSEDVINKLLDISINTVDHSYDICDILDYFQKYSFEHPEQSLFYKNITTSNNAASSKTSRITTSKKSEKNKSVRISNFLKTKSLSKTHKLSRKTQKHFRNKSGKQYSRKTKPTDIKYIEDFELPGFETILEDADIQYRTMILCNKLEAIFIECFEKINNMILNQLETNDRGALQVKPYAIATRKLNDVKRFVNMLEMNNIAYNKHIITIMKEEEDKLVDNFYNLDNTINTTLIKYNDHETKALIRKGLDNFHLCKGYSFDVLIKYFESINLAYRIKNNLLDILELKRAPRIVQRAYEDFTRGLKDYITSRYSSKLPHSTVSNAFVKLWECLTVFDIIPRGKTNKFRVFHICEAPGQMILACKYFTEQKRKNITDYEWIANSLNPFNKTLQNEYGDAKIFGDDYGLIRKNPQKWLWGADNTGDITQVKNIKWFKNYITNKFVGNSKLDLIVGDGGLNTELDPLMLQKLDLAQVIMVMACSSQGGSCIIKHFTPYIKRHTDTFNASGFFMGFLYLYYLTFSEVSLFKPYSSNPDGGEFYVVGQGFNGIDDAQLDRLYKIIDNFELNDGIIPKDMIPETFISQVNAFLEKISNLNTMSIEKQNLLLTCYKDSKNPKVSKYLKCNRFLDEDNLQTILVPRYTAWIKKYQFV